MTAALPARAASVAPDEAPPLRIARVEAIPISLPLRKPVVMAGERIEHTQNLLVRIEAANGLIGWGEASSASLMTGDLLPGMVAAVDDHLAPLLTGKDALARAELAAACERALLHNTGAKCAVEMALQDLVGQHLEVSVADLFGGALREIARPMYLLGNPKVEDDIAEANAKIAEGWSFFKLKIGIKDPAEEAAAAVALRAHIGPAVALCADANMGMSFAAARLFAERAREANLLFIEQPLHADDHEGMAALARASAIPLNGDEAISSVASILALHRAGAIQGANLKTIKLGGMGPVVRAMHVCGALGLSINLACKVAESSISAAALVHLACLAPNIDWGLSLTNHYLAEDVSREPITIRGGALVRPRGPGLGVTVDEAQVRRLQLRR
jgi:L-alanine-DL-glutamate epimerase-like enolase superfamily enzyme